jgi:hypothetical protein
MRGTVARAWLAGALGAATLAGCAASGQQARFVANPEPGLQGQQLAADKPGSVLEGPYLKGLRIVGREPIRARDSNVQLAWVDHCAYVSSTAGPFPLLGTMQGNRDLIGVAVIDVSRPGQPRLVRLLRDKGSIAVLAAGAYHGGANGAGTSSGHDPEAGPAWLSLYDLSDCANPRLVAETAWPENAHTVTIAPDGRTVFGTAMNPFTGEGGLQAMDISDLARPRFLGKFGATRPDGSSFAFASHEISFSPDGRRIYAGVNASKSDDLNRAIAIFPPNARALGNDGGGIFILDSSDFADRRANPRLRLIGTMPGGGWHSVRPARIGGVPHLVGGAELGACPGTWPRITRIADEAQHRMVGEFRLAMNRPENCPAPSAADKAGGGIVPAPGTATLHYNHVDDAEDTRLGLFNFMWAGLRIADLRNPAAPTEIAYFKPGDVCTGHVRYRRETGHIWLVCARSGFWVLELAPEIRAMGGLAADRGRP